MLVRSTDGGETWHTHVTPDTTGSNGTAISQLSDGTYYIGQTTDLVVRLQEHRDGQQEQTEGKQPELVYYEFLGGVMKCESQRTN